MSNNGPINFYPSGNLFPEAPSILLKSAVRPGPASFVVHKNRNLYLILEKSRVLRSCFLNPVVHQEYNQIDKCFETHLHQGLVPEGKKSRHLVPAFQNSPGIPTHSQTKGDSFAIPLQNSNSAYPWNDITRH